MKFVDIDEATSQLSELVDEAVNGQDFTITSNGNPVALLSSLESPRPTEQRRLGFMSGFITVPDDFDRMFEKEITQVFEN